VVLGIINPDNFFGGRRALDPKAALAAIDERVAKPLDLSPIEAAAGIYEVVTAKMADLIRKATIESGNDPKQFCLLSYGGAGGAHCAVFSAQLGIQKVIIPYAAPVFSAFGCAFSDVLCTHSKSEPIRLQRSPETVAVINATLGELKSRVLSDMRTAGFDPDELLVRYKIDLRYEGQMNEVTLAWNSDQLAEADLDRLREAFERLYAQKFGAGTTHAKSALELISFRAEAVKEVPKPDLAPVFTAANGRGRESHARSRRVYQHGLGWLEADVYEFDHLEPGRLYTGPAVIERQSTTVWLPVRAAARVDVFGNLDIEPGR
jgi:N-methylhydantoinase A